jgi:hypothetical protein
MGSLWWLYDDPFSNMQFGIDGNETFIPFNATRTIVHFDTHVPMDWETHNLPTCIVMLTGEEWDPVMLDSVQFQT